MNIKTYLETLYDYNYWANHRYLKVAKSLTKEQIFRKQGHSWDNVHAVLVYMMSSENIWLRRWQGEAPKNHFSPDSFPTFASIQESWSQLEDEMLDFLTAQNEQSLQEDTVCIGFNGGTFHLPLWQMMTHVPNHNVHHRSELAAMFSLMNITHSEEEMVQYFLVKSGQRRE